MTGNWPNEGKISWSKASDVFGTTNQIIFFFLPWIILLFIFIFRRKLGSINPSLAKYLYNIMGLFAIGWELWFDIASIASPVGAIGHNTPIEQFWSGFDLCRLNMYLVGVFLLFRKIDWIKWLVATALWGGTSTLFNHYNNSATIHSLVTHAIVLPTFPAIAISMAKTNYSAKSYVYAHLFNWTIVLFLIATNYGLDRHAGELHEAHLKDNALVGWAPYGLRIILWIVVVMVVEFCYFTLFRYIYWQTYAQKEIKRTFLSFKIFNKQFSLNSYKRPTQAFWAEYAQTFRDSLKEIPMGPKLTFLAAKTNVINAVAFAKRLK